MSSPVTNAEIYRTIKDKQDDAVLAAQDLAIILFPQGTDIGPVVDDTTGDLLPLVAGGMSLGEIQKAAGANLSPEMSTEGILGYGSRAQRRIFVTEESMSMDFSVQEFRLEAWKAFNSIADEDVTHSKFVTRMKKRDSGELKYYSMLIIAKDLLAAGEIFPFWKFNKVAITQKGQQSLTESSEIGVPMTFTAMSDDNGEQYEIGLGGKGWPSVAKAIGITLPTGA